MDGFLMFNAAAVTTATVAIAFFAYRTWKATHVYAVVAGIDLFIRILDATGKTAGADRERSQRAARALRKALPNVWAELRDVVGTETRNFVEGEGE